MSMSLLSYEVSREVSNPIFLDPSETLVSSLERGVLSHLVLGGNLASEFVLLSDRRVYYSGKYIKGRRFDFGQVILPLDAVSSVFFFEAKLYGAALTAMMLLGFGFLSAIFTQDIRPILFSLVPAIILWVVFLLSVKRLFIVSSNSASIEIEFKAYGAEAIQTFARHLGAAMDRAKTSSSFPQQTRNGQDEEQLISVPPNTVGQADG